MDNGVKEAQEGQMESSSGLKLSLTLTQHKNNPSDLGYEEIRMKHEQAQWLRFLFSYS